MTLFHIDPILPIHLFDSTRERNGYTALRIWVDAGVTQEQIDALQLPKYVGNLRPRRGCDINLTPNQTTGEINERGIKRVAAFLAGAKGHYEMVEARCINSASIEEFCKYHNIEVAA